MLKDMVRAASGAGLFSRPRTLRHMADHSRDARRWPEAAALYRRYLQFKPADAAIWVQLGHALKESGQIDEAHASYGRALILEPSVSDTYLQLGHLLKIASRVDEAAGAYGRAIQLDPSNRDARDELDRLTKSNGSGGAAATTDPFDEALLPVPLDNFDDAVRPTMVFDVSDLMSYFRNARLPTGIQRVQIEAICALLRVPHDDIVGICAFTEKHDRWARIPNDLFLQVCDLSLSGGDKTEPEWIAAIRKCLGILRHAAEMRFAQGAVLINLGTSWWLQNYFLNVRNAKRDYGVVYIPFVHDLIPVMTPQHCVRGLTEDFITWIVGAFDHADHFLVNSQATRTDLISVAHRLGHTLADGAVTVVPLNADFRKQNDSTQRHEYLKKYNLEPQQYVLFVATIESRKNHLAAFSAWLALIRKYGAVKIPTLVCVGNEGWLNAEVYARLESSILRSHVLMLSKLPDDELASFYDNCLFTLYPSLYEGWGLPITESLCHGKIPLISAASSLPEAGGKFAEYFEASSEDALIEALERLIFDNRYRQDREQFIRDNFRPRSWLQIGTQVRDACATVRQATIARIVEPDRGAATVQLGAFHPFTRNREIRIWPGMKAGEMFRSGGGWWGPDDFGTWTKRGGGEIVARVEGPHPRLRGYFGLVGLHKESAQWTFDFVTSAETMTMEGMLGPSQKNWITCEFRESREDTVIRMRICGDKLQDLGDFTGGADARLTSIGLHGFYICEAADLVARANFTEAFVLGNLALLRPGASMSDAAIPA